MELLSFLTVSCGELKIAGFTNQPLFSSRLPFQMYFVSSPEASVLSMQGQRKCKYKRMMLLLCMY